MRVEGVSKDYAEALDLLMVASDAGHANASASAAFILLHGGHGVQPDHARSVALTCSAAERGDVGAMANAAFNCAQGIGGANPANAQRWARRARKSADLQLGGEHLALLRRLANGGSMGY